MGVPVHKELRTYDEGGEPVVNLLAHKVLRASAEFFRKARAMRHKLLWFWSRSRSARGACNRIPNAHRSATTGNTQQRDPGEKG
jgi:hypothetical protein